MRADSAGSSSPAISVEMVSKRFGAISALKSVSFEVAADELLVVVGPTGAGKTTLLRTLCGLESPDSGRVSLAGQEVTHAPTAERDLAMVFQNFSLYPRFTVRQNLEFPLKAPGRQVSPSEIQRRVAWAAELLRLGHLLDRPAPKLSGGEMQRVAIGRAIVREPVAFLMDEPLTNLDAKLREALRTELVELRRRVGRAMVYVTHDPAEALAMGDRVVALSAGQVLQVGTPQRVYDWPESPVVARQLGQPKINLLSVERVGEAWCLSGAPLPIAASAFACPGGDVSGRQALLGVRPEHLRLEAVQDADPQAPATVRLVEYMGASSTVVLDWLGQIVRASIEGVCRFEPRQRVGVRIERGLLWART